MTRLARLIKGLGALILLAVVVAGIPWALWHFVGWPLPHHLPAAGQVGRALNRQGIPAQTLVDALAVVVWVTWATLVASIVVEVPAALSGRRPPRIPLGGLFQPVTGRLVAAVIVACLTLAPRPAHTGPGATSSGTPVMGSRPVAALVVRDAVLTAATAPTPTTQTAAAPAATTASPAPTPTQAPSTPDIYVVQRGDTLWGIAQRQLGDPLRWSDIYQLNEGRPQPGGATLTDPHWIDPGWTLILPQPPTPIAAPPAPATAPTGAPPATSPSTTTQPPPTPASPPSTVTPTTPTTIAPSHSVPDQSRPAAPRTPVSPPANGDATRHPGGSTEPVRLPSGSVIAGSFAAGVLSAVALGRLRKRHAYRYRPPEPGRDLTPEPLRPTLRHLTHAAGADHDPETAPPAQDVPAPPFDDDERRLDPGRLEVAARDNESITIDITGRYPPVGAPGL